MRNNMKIFTVVNFIVLFVVASVLSLIVFRSAQGYYDDKIAMYESQAKQYELEQQVTFWRNSDHRLKNILTPASIGLPGTN